MLNRFGQQVDKAKVNVFIAIGEKAQTMYDALQQFDATARVFNLSSFTSRLGGYAQYTNLIMTMLTEDQVAALSCIRTVDPIQDGMWHELAKAWKD